MFTQEDLKPHRTAVVFLMDDDRKILVMHHKKHNMLAPIIGKAFDTEPVVNAAAREAMEEVGVVIDVRDLEPIGSYSKKYDFDGKEVWIETFCYLARRWSGVPENREPNKHSDLRFAGPKEIVAEAMSGARVADSLRFAFGLDVL